MISIFVTFNMRIPDRIRQIQPTYLLMGIYAIWLLSLKNRDTGGVDDFDVFFNAGKRLLAGENIYGEPHYINLKYFYSPLFASLMALVQDFGLKAVKWIWFIVNSLLLFRVLYILLKQLPDNTRWKNGIFFILLFIIAKIILINYSFNQITIIILWTVIESYRLLREDKMIAAVVILCIGINFKILPIVMVPYFIWMSFDRLKMLSYGIGCLLALTFLPAVFIGWDYNLMLLSEWWKTLNPVSEIHVMQTYEYGFLDLSSLITKFLSDEAVYLEPKLNIASWSMSSLFILTNAIRAILLGLVVLLAFKIRKQVAGIHQHLIITVAFMALVPICFPHQREYSYLFFTPLWLVLMTLIVRRNKVQDYMMFIFLVLASGLLTWVDFVGKDIVNLFLHYRIITMGMTGMLLYYIIFVIRNRNDESFKALS